jgi:hypothetical protein
MIRIQIEVGKNKVVKLHVLKKKYLTLTINDMLVI